MPSSVKPNEFGEIIATIDGDFCERYISSLGAGAIFSRWFKEFWNADGTLSDSTKSMICLGVITCIPPVAVSWTSTKEATVSCPPPTTGSSVTRSGTATSTVSQADADAKALAAATANATAALSCSSGPTIGRLSSTLLWASIGQPFAIVLRWYPVSGATHYLIIQDPHSTNLNDYVFGGQGQTLVGHQLLTYPFTGPKNPQDRNMGGLPPRIQFSYSVVPLALDNRGIALAVGPMSNIATGITGPFIA